MHARAFGEPVEQPKRVAVWIAEYVAVGEPFQEPVDKPITRAECKPVREPLAIAQRKPYDGRRLLAPPAVLGGVPCSCCCGISLLPSCQRRIHGLLREHAGAFAACASNGEAVAITERAPDNEPEHAAFRSAKYIAVDVS